MLSFTDVSNLMTSMYGEAIGAGNERMCWDRGDGYVIKVPYDDAGAFSNGVEADWQHSDYIPLAKCWLDWLDGFPYALLIMEKVTPVRDFSNLPKWTNAVDCVQVGYTVDGKLVAFDP